jgi:hypothetical protein
MGTRPRHPGASAGRQPPLKVWLCFWDQRNPTHRSCLTNDGPVQWPGPPREPATGPGGLEGSSTPAANLLGLAAVTVNEITAFVSIEAWPFRTVA